MTISDVEEVCDFCGAAFPFGERRAVVTAKPSDPTMAVAIMWGCGNCDDSAQLPKAVDVIASVLEDELVFDQLAKQNRRFFFVNV